MQDSSLETPHAGSADLAAPLGATLEDFMIDDDDPRVHATRHKLAAESSDEKAVQHDWPRCESRHQRERAENRLGTKRPLTHWSEDGTTRLPDYGWQDWCRAQVDRVKDVMDVNYLKCVVHKKERGHKKATSNRCSGYDAQYKTQVWNLNQNVDRQSTTKFGLTPCICPRICPFVTTRGRLFVGEEP